MINSSGYVSRDYPSLSQLVEITASDYAKLRRILAERGEIEKFIKWHSNKFIRLTTQTYAPIPYSPTFNSSIYRPVTGQKKES